MTPIARVLMTASLVVSAATLAAQQVRDGGKSPLSGTAQISGTVTTNDQPPAPLRRATVVLIGDRLAERVTAVTDDAGAFAFTSLPADRYSLSATKAGYVPMNFGSKRPGGSGTPLVVAEGQRATAAMKLLRGSVLTGTVRDALGRPVPDVTMTAMRYAVSLDSGERTIQSVRIGSAGSMNSSYLPDAFPGTAMTDDRGEYRIFGLPAGEYILSASVRPPRASIFANTDLYQITPADLQRAQQLLRGSPSGAAAEAASGQPGAGGRVDFAPVYHPGALAIQDAATIKLGAEEERSGIDVVVRLVATASITGVITAPDGSPISRAQVSIMDPRPGGSGVFLSAQMNEDGEFRIQSVPPGRYSLQGSAYQQGLSGRTEVVVDGRDVSASFVLSPGVTVSGRIVFDGKLPVSPASTAIPVLRMKTWGLSAQRFESSAGGVWAYRSVAPGTYWLGLSGRLPSGWILRSAMANGVDVSDVAFEVKPGQNVEDVVITVTDRPAEIAGTLQNAAGGPATDYVLVLFSADSRRWIPRARRTRQVRPDANGQFIVRDLPAGDYLLAAVTDIEDGQWNDPTFLAALAASSPVKITLAEGDRKTQDIRIGR